MFLLGLGIAACSYFARLQKECNLPEIGVEKLPKECSSFIYDGLKVNPTYEITDANNAEIEST